MPSYPMTRSVGSSTLTSFPAIGPALAPPAPSVAAKPAAVEDPGTACRAGLKTGGIPPVGLMGAERSMSVGRETVAFVEADAGAAVGAAAVSLQ